MTTSRPSTSKPGIVRGTEPAARITAGARQHRAGVLAVEDLDGPVRTEPPGAACTIVTLRPVRSPDEPLEQPVDDLLLAALADREVGRDLARREPELVGVLERPVDVGGLQELLRGHAAAVQARPADLLALDDRDVEPRRGAVEGGGVAAGAPADDDDVVVRLLRGHAASFPVGPSSDPRSAYRSPLPLPRATTSPHRLSEATMPRRRRSTEAKPWRRRGTSSGRGVTAGHFADQWWAAV